MVNESNSRLESCLESSRVESKKKKNYRAWEYRSTTAIQRIKVLLISIISIFRNENSFYQYLRYSWYTGIETVVTEHFNSMSDSILCRIALLGVWIALVCMNILAARQQCSLYLKKKKKREENNSRKS